MSKPLAATLTAALAVDTIGHIQPEKGILLPAPKYYLATWLLWFILGLVAAVGPRASRAASQLSVLVLLTMAVAGPFGGKLVNFLNGAGRFFPAAQGGTP